MTSLLKEKYLKEARAALQKKFNYANPMQIPMLKAVVVSMGVAEASKDKSDLQRCDKELTLITGQKPLHTKARKAISNFKLREGQTIGMKVTLRGTRMYDWVYFLANIVCPRIRDFRGLPSKCDGRGNYSMGLTDQQIFPQINLDDVKRTQGMNITFVTTAKTDAEAVELLTLLGLPIKK
ncbi:MAG: rplE [Chlamydiales bacterium]|jgi:large subunit ribosomal protein L5|nr:rplE [Chlamydiales bacterium]